METLETHHCAYHRVDHETAAFRIKSNGRLDSWCIEGRREYNRRYSQEAYAPRKAQVTAARKARDQRTEQTCTRCLESKPIDDFPFRYDRPDKRESRCDLCLGRIRRQASHDYHVNNRDAIRINKRDYRTRNPDRVRDHSRKRRARKNRVRHEPFTEAEIRTRDQGLCYFCGEYVDPDLQYPDLRAQVIHHIHPVAKGGPHAASNVALAHNQCNARQSDKCASSFGDAWSVRPIPNALARRIAQERHYLRRPQNASFAFGLFKDEELLGMVSFGSTTSWRINLSICPSDPHAVIELNRLWLDPQAPFGAASWFVSRALRALPPRIIVSYADTGVEDVRNGRCHDGSVYRALSFAYAGRSRPRKEWRMPGSSRNAGKVAGAEAVMVSAKERYWTVTGTKRDRKRLRRLCQWPQLIKEAPMDGASGSYERDLEKRPQKRLP